MRFVRRRPLRTENGEHGFVIVWVAAMMITLLSVTALAIDVGLWYVVANRVQHQADTAALAGAVEMPDFNAATVTAFDNLVRNGVCSTANENTTTHYCSGNSGTTTGQVIAIPNDPTKVQVTVCRTVKNSIAAILNYKNQTVCKTAVAAYQAAIAMGSPINSLSNQPMPELNTTKNGNWGSPSNVNFWLEAAGYQLQKSQGDRYLAGTCGTQYDGHTPAELCASSAFNDGGSAGANNGGGEYNKNGYYYVVRVAPGTTGTLGIDAFDPEFADTGLTCGDGQRGYPATYFTQSDANFDPNLYQTGLGTAGQKYCAGDSANTGDDGNSYNNVETLFAVHAADQTSSYTDNPIMTSAGCTPTQFGSFGAVTSAHLTDKDPSQPSASALTLQGEFRKWVRLCTIAVSNTSTIPQDYLVQVTTALEYDSVTKTLVTDSNSASEGGQNHFSLRAGLVTGGVSSDPVSEPIATSKLSTSTGVTVFAGGQLPIYQNTTGSANFYLANVAPTSNSRTLQVDFWDVGDASGGGTITVVPPSGATVVSGGHTVSFNSFTGCQLRIGASGTVTNPSTCAVGVTNQTGNGRLISLFIPIPSTYSCGTNVGTDCWIKVNFNYPSGLTVNDTTTWTVTMDGNPVRLTL
jgi:hypothetical protein